MTSLNRFQNAHVHDFIAPQGATIQLFQLNPYRVIKDKEEEYVQLVPVDRLNTSRPMARRTLRTVCMDGGHVIRWDQASSSSRYKTIKYNGITVPIYRLETRLVLQKSRR